MLYPSWSTVQGREPEQQDEKAELAHDNHKVAVADTNRADNCNGLKQCRTQNIADQRAAPDMGGLLAVTGQVAAMPAPATQVATAAPMEVRKSRGFSGV